MPVDYEEREKSDEKNLESFIGFYGKVNSTSSSIF